MADDKDPEYWLAQAEKGDVQFTPVEGIPTSSDSEGAVQRRVIELSLSQLLVDMRTHAGLTQAQLASRLNKSRPAIAQAEKRPLENCSIGLVSEIAEACGFSFNPAKGVEPLPAEPVRLRS